MRDAPIVEIGIREISNFCEFAELAYGYIDKTGRQEAIQTYFYVHSFLSHGATVARLLSSQDLAGHAGGTTIAEILDVPGKYWIENETARTIVDRYDMRLAEGLASRGEVAKILDYNIGDRDAFEEEFTVFLRHYDPTVDTLTLMEEELNLGRIAAELAEVKSRAEAWLESNATLVDRPATVSIPPTH